MSVRVFEDAVVSRYVKALYEVSIGRESEFLNQVRAVREAIGSLESGERFFKRISLLPKEGELLVDALTKELNLLPEIGNFLKLVLSNKRFSAILDICEAYEKFFNHMNDAKVFYVTYARSFPEGVKGELSRQLQELFGGKIEFVSCKDESLVGGFQVRYGSKILDYSIKSKLDRLKMSIKGERRV